MTTSGTGNFFYDLFLGKIASFLESQLMMATKLPVFEGHSILFCAGIVVELTVRNGVELGLALLYAQHWYS